MFDQYIYHVNYNTQYAKELIDDNYKIFSKETVEYNKFIMQINDNQKILYKKCLPFYKIEDNYFYLCLLNEDYLLDYLFVTNNNIIIDSKIPYHLKLIEFTINDQIMRINESFVNLVEDKLAFKTKFYEDGFNEFNEFNEFNSKESHNKFVLYDNYLICKVDKNNLVAISLIQDNKIFSKNNLKILLLLPVIAVVASICYFIFNNNSFYSNTDNNCKNEISINNQIKRRL